MTPLERSVRWALRAGGVALGVCIIVALAGPPSDLGWEWWWAVAGVGAAMLVTFLVRVLWPEPLGRHSPGVPALEPERQRVRPVAGHWPYDWSLDDRTLAQR